MFCNRCGKENPEEALFCMYCGAPVEQKKTCPNCGTVNSPEAAFCFRCGAPLAASAPAVKKPRDRSGALTVAGGAFLVAAALFALVFTFCIGLTTIVNPAELLSGDSVRASARVDIYNYFVDIYRAIGDTLRVMTEYDIEYTVEYAVSLYLPAALGTAAVAAALVAVPVCTMVAAVRYIRNVRNHTARSIVTPAATAYAFFLFAACTLLMLNNMWTESTDGTTLYSARIGFNGATVAGIVLGAVFLAAGCALLVAAKGKEAFLSRLTQTVAALIGTAIFAVLISQFAACPVTLSQTGGTSGNAAGVTLYRLFGLFDSTLSADPCYLPVFITATVSLAAQFLGLIFTALLFVQLMRRFTGEKSAPLLLFAIPLFLCSLAMLVSGIICASNVTDMLQANALSVAFSFSHTAPIVALVFSLLLFVPAVAECVLRRKPEQKPQKEQSE